MNQMIDGTVYINILKGRQLVPQDGDTSDPKVELNIQGTKLKTEVIKKTLNPVWNAKFTQVINTAKKVIFLLIKNFRL